MCTYKPIYIYIYIYEFLNQIIQNSQAAANCNGRDLNTWWKRLKDKKKKRASRHHSPNPAYFVHFSFFLSSFRLFSVLVFFSIFKNLFKKKNGGSSEAECGCFFFHLLPKLRVFFCSSK